MAAWVTLTQQIISLECDLPKRRDGKGKTLCPPRRCGDNSVKLWLHEIMRE